MISSDLLIRCTYFGEFKTKASDDSSVKEEMNKVLHLCEGLCGVAGIRFNRKETIYIQESSSIFEYGIKTSQDLDTETIKKIKTPNPW